MWWWLSLLLYDSVEQYVDQNCMKISTLSLSLCKCDDDCLTLSLWLCRTIWEILKILMKISTLSLSLFVNMITMIDSLSLWLCRTIFSIFEKSLLSLSLKRKISLGIEIYVFYVFSFRFWKFSTLSLSLCQYDDSITLYDSVEQYFVRNENLYSLSLSLSKIKNLNLRQSKRSEENVETVERRHYVWRRNLFNLPLSLCVCVCENERENNNHTLLTFRSLSRSLSLSHPLSLFIYTYIENEQSPPHYFFLFFLTPSIYTLVTRKCCIIEAFSFTKITLKF